MSYRIYAHGHVLSLGLQLLVLNLMRAIALGGFSGGLASALVSLLSYGGEHSVDFASPVCPAIHFDTPHSWRIDLKSLVIGVVIGLILGPVLEVISLLRQLWALQVRGWLRLAPQTAREPYRVVG